MFDNWGEGIGLSMLGSPRLQSDSKGIARQEQVFPWYVSQACAGGSSQRLVTVLLPSLRPG